MGGKRERIASRMDELPEEVREQAESMLLDRTLSYAEIAQKLTEQGYPISKSSVGRYAQRTGRATMRLQYIRENANAIITAMREHRGLELSDAANAIVMDNLIQALSTTSAEEYSEIPLAKLIDLALKQQRNAVYKARMIRNYEHDLERIRKAMMDELREQVQNNPDLIEQIDAASQAAAQRVRDDNEDKR